MPVAPHKMKVADLRAEIARLEAVEARALRAAALAYDHRLEAEHVREAYDASERAAELAAHLPAKH